MTISKSCRYCRIQMLLRSQIDSIVALEFIAIHINKSPTMCKELLVNEEANDISLLDPNDPTKTKKYVQLFRFLNGGINVVPVPASIQLAKSIFINKSHSQVPDVAEQDLVRQFCPIDNSIIHMNHSADSSVICNSCRQTQNIPH